MSTEFTHDVFLSYHRDDKRRVRQIAEGLRDGGLIVWFDEWELDPANRGKVLDRGLWALTRHPNYFGAAVLPRISRTECPSWKSREGFADAKRLSAAGSAGVPPAPSRRRRRQRNGAGETPALPALQPLSAPKV